MRTNQMRIVSVHKFRRTARKRERELQAQIEEFQRLGYLEKFLFDNALPNWTRGVKVEKAGWFQWTVVATPNRGH